MSKQLLAGSFQGNAAYLALRIFNSIILFILKKVTKR